MIIAYLVFLKVHNNVPTKPPRVEGEAKDEFGPPRTEKGSYPLKRPGYTLEDLLVQIPEPDTHNEDTESREFGPPRTEKGSYPLKPPNYTLEDLLAQVTEDNAHKEIDTGLAVGKEVCWD